jgi:hypothetical protein
MIKKMIVLFMLLVTTVFSQVEGSWLRIDGDQNGQIVWVGGSNGDRYVHNVVWYLGANLIEADFGAHLFKEQMYGKYDVMALYGFLADGNGEILFTLPQLYWFSASERHYSELWYVMYLTDQPYLTDNHWVLGMERFAVTPNIKVGPQFEWYYDYETTETTSLPIGLGVQIPYGGVADYIDLSLSYDIVNEVNTMRLTYFKLF